MTGTAGAPGPDCDLCSNGQRCVDHGCRECGGIILADTEDWKLPLCFDCFITLGEPAREPDWTKVCLVVCDSAEFSPLVKLRRMSQTVAWAEAPCPVCQIRMGDHLIGEAGTLPRCPGVPEHLA